MYSDLTKVENGSGFNATWYWSCLLSFRPHKMGLASMQLGIEVACWASVKGDSELVGLGFRLTCTPAGLKNGQMLLCSRNGSTSWSFCFVCFVDISVYFGRKDTLNHVTFFQPLWWPCVIATRPYSNQQMHTHHAAWLTLVLHAFSPSIFDHLHAVAINNRKQEMRLPYYK